jgi:DNA primase
MTKPAGRHAGPDSELTAVVGEAAWFFRHQHMASWVPGYLAGLGIPYFVQQNWHVGYAPAGRDALIMHLRAAGYRDLVIVAAGLARRSRYGTLTDTFRDRAMLPVRSADGTVIAFIGRAAEPAGPGVPKYLNSPGTALYSKGDVLFGLWEARHALAAGATPVITEGPLDAIAVGVASKGSYAPVTPCGTALTARQVAALDQAQAAGIAQRDVLVAFDADEAGRLAVIAAYHLLAGHTAAVTTLTLPAGQDPAQILQDHGPAALADALANSRQPLADLVIDAEIAKRTRWLSCADGQIAALRDLAPVIAAMPPSDVGRQVGRVAARLDLDLDHAIVTEAVTDALTAHSSVKARLASRLVPAQGAVAAGRVRAPDFPAGATPGAVAVVGRPAQRGRQAGGPTGEQAGLRTRRIPG